MRSDPMPTVPGWAAVASCAALMAGCTALMPREYSHRSATNSLPGTRARSSECLLLLQGSGGSREVLGASSEAE